MANLIQSGSRQVLRHTISTNLPARGWRLAKYVIHIPRNFCNARCLCRISGDPQIYDDISTFQNAHTRSIFACPWQNVGKWPVACDSFQIISSCSSTHRRRSLCAGASCQHHVDQQFAPARSVDNTGYTPGSITKITCTAHRYRGTRKRSDRLGATDHR